MKYLNKLNKIAEYTFYAFIFLLPWQTRWIWYKGMLNGQPWEYGSFSLYGADILIALVIIISLFISRRQPKQTNGWKFLLAGFFIISFASIFWSQDREMSWYGVGKLAEGMLIFWAASRLNFFWRKVAYAFTASGLIQAGIGIYQFFSQQVVANKWLGMASHGPAVLGDYVVETASGRWLRAYGALPHPNMLAGWLALCVVIFLGLIFLRKREVRQNLFYRISDVFILIILSVGLILTFSRSAWLALIVVLLFMLTRAIKQKDLFRTRTVGLVIFIFLLTVMTSFLIMPDLWQTRISGGRLEQKSSAERVSQYQQAKIVITDFWYQGAGINAYTAALYNRDITHPAWEYQPVHDIYLLAIAETGIFGGLIFLILISKFLKSFYIIFWRAEGGWDWAFVFGSAFLLLLIIGLFDHYLWTLSFGMILFWLTLGLWHRPANSDLEGVDKSG